MPSLFDLDKSNDFEVECGVDEAGRGPLAGPVIAAAVVLDTSKPILGIRDSKQLTHKRRVELAHCIRERALAWSLGRCEPREIDELNILRASLLAMERAVEQIDISLDVALVDGNVAPRLNCSVVTVVGGDRRVVSIGAASILAKVARDEEMKVAGAKFPNYGFQHNKGYPTPQHLAALKLHGPCSIHRKTFRPVAESLSEDGSMNRTLNVLAQ
ncbi:MAG: ribonuclease HII [Gammaproteobacteria bacterium]|nr:ribonuclease HII [Gammaproteobacteria bacterium]